MVPFCITFERAVRLPKNNFFNKGRGKPGPYGAQKYLDVSSLPVSRRPGWARLVNMDFIKRGIEGTPILF
jgi:hypothetical protein